MKTKIYLKSKGRFLIVERGSISAAQLLHVLKEFRKTIKKKSKVIGKLRDVSPTDGLFIVECKENSDYQGYNINCGSLSANSIVLCIDNISQEITKEVKVAN